MIIGNKLPKKAKDEKTVLVLRRHWFVFFYQLLFYIILGFIPIALYFFFIYFSANFFESNLIKALTILGTSIYYLFIWGFLYTTFIDYNLDVWIVTNYRIVNIEQIRLFSRTWSQHNLDVVQDVTVDVKGIFPTLLNYGDIIIQTAGPKIFFVFKQIPNPYEVSKKITILVEEYKTKANK